MYGAWSIVQRGWNERRRKVVEDHSTWGVGTLAGCSISSAAVGGLVWPSIVSSGPLPVTVHTGTKRAHTNIYIYTCVWVCVCVCVYDIVCLCLFVCVCVPTIYTMLRTIYHRVRQRDRQCGWPEPLVPLQRCSPSPAGQREEGCSGRLSELVCSQTTWSPSVEDSRPCYHEHTDRIEMFSRHCNSNILLWHTCI